MLCVCVCVCVWWRGSRPRKRSHAGPHWLLELRLQLKGFASDLDERMVPDASCCNLSKTGPTTANATTQNSNNAKIDPIINHNKSQACLLLNETIEDNGKCLHRGPWHWLSTFLDNVVSISNKNDIVVTKCVCVCGGVSLSCRVVVPLCSKG